MGKLLSSQSFTSHYLGEKMRHKIRNLAIILIIIALLGLFWEKILFILWLRLPWWGLLLLISGLLILFDLAIEKLFGKTY